MKAPSPPNYREGSAQEHCGNCRMYDQGRCWGYGDVPVKNDYVCDSWASTDSRQHAKRLWADHRRRLKEA